MGNKGVNMVKMPKYRSTVTIIETLESLFPNSEWQLQGEKIYANLEWLDKDTTKPTEAEIDAEIIRLQAEHTGQDYARKRQADYPSRGDQFDMIYKDMKNSTTTHADAVEAVKTKWPKDNSGPVE